MSKRRKPPKRRTPDGDPWNTPEFKAYVMHATTELVPMMLNSSIVISMVPKNGADVKFGIELGFSIMMDKPILAVVEAGQPVPGKLRLVADEIVEVDDLGSEAGQRLVLGAIQRMQERFPAEGEEPA